MKWDGEHILMCCFLNQLHPSWMLLVTPNSSAAKVGTPLHSVKTTLLWNTLTEGLQPFSFDRLAKSSMYLDNGWRWLLPKDI